MARIFISYKRIDKNKVLPIADRIRQELNEPCWMDIDEIESDAQFASEIINAIDEASVFLFMFSIAHTKIKNFATDWTIRELNYAQEKRKRIVFVNIDNTPLTNWFIFMFPQKQQVNALSETDLEKLLKNISNWLRIAKPEAPQSTTIVNTEKGFSFGETQKETPLPQDYNQKEPPLLQDYNQKEPPLLQDHNQKEPPLLQDHNQKETPLLQDYNQKETHLRCEVKGIPFTMIKISNEAYIGETLVTQLLWVSIMGKNPSRFKGDDKPVDSVSWNDCKLFINRLNYLTKMQFRLPTETEWEFAAKGGEKSHNYQYSGSNNLNDVAWNLNNSYGRTHPVKQKKANELGLYDMSGNVWEWCDDKCEEIIDSYQKTATNSPRVVHPIKGGCWCETEKCKLTAREVWPPTYQGTAGLGIRLAMTILPC